MPDADDPWSEGPIGANGALRLLTLCTGNAARSVMAGVMLGSGPFRIRTAGTHVLEGRPMSYRTRDALAAVGLQADGHRSRQVTDLDIEHADLVLAMAGEHVGFVRRRYPQASAKTATIKRLCRDLPAGPDPLADRIGSLGLEGVSLDRWEDVEDPAGGDDEDYVACAKELHVLCAELVIRLS